MNAKFAIVLTALSMLTVMLQAGSSPTAPSQQEEQGSIARGGEYREDSLENREDRTEDRPGGQARQDSLENRQDRAQDRQSN